MTTVREGYISGLREYAQWLEDNPDVPTPTEYSRTIFLYMHGGKEEAATIARAAGNVSKQYAGDDFYMKREFGGLTISWYWPRERVCERVQVGTKIEPAREAVPEREVPVYEWTCEPVLAESKGGEDA